MALCIGLRLIICYIVEIIKGDYYHLRTFDDFGTVDAMLLFTIVDTVSVFSLPMQMP